MTKRWTAAETETLRQAYHQGVPDRDVARALGRPIKSISSRRRKIGLYTPAVPRIARDWIRVGCLRSMADIIEDVSKRRGVSVFDIKGPMRFKAINAARQEFMAEAYATGRWSMPQIGKFLGGRDHTTVLHGIRQHTARVEDNSSVPLADL